MAQKWTRATDVIWEELKGGALLIDVRTGARWLLNTTAAALWKQCDGLTRLRGTSVEIRAFLKSLAAKNLLIPATSNGGAIVRFSAPTPPSIQSLGLGHGPRTRPGPRGNSSPG